MRLAAVPPRRPGCFARPTLPFLSRFVGRASRPPRRRRASAAGATPLMRRQHRVSGSEGCDGSASADKAMSWRCARGMLSRGMAGRGARGPAAAATVTKARIRFARPTRPTHIHTSLVRVINVPSGAPLMPGSARSNCYIARLWPRCTPRASRACLCGAAGPKFVFWAGLDVLHDPVRRTWGPKTMHRSRQFAPWKCYEGSMSLEIGTKSAPGARAHVQETCTDSARSVQ